jgi:hypothetical protein
MTASLLSAALCCTNAATPFAAFGQTGAATTAAQTQTNSPPAKASKPIKLYGRIEELCEVPGAKIPIKLQAQTPKFDTRRPLTGQARTTTQSGIVTSAAYPIDWAGVWSGELKIWTAQFSPNRWKFDAAEASKEQELMKPGKDGQVTFNFALDSQRQIQLAPTQVVFSAPMDQQKAQDMMQQMQQMMGGAPGLFGQGPGSAMAMQMIQSVPYMYAMHLGDLRQGTGVTGNMLDSQVVKNNVKVLAANTLEQQIVTYFQDQNRSTGQTRTGYCETVLRFTRLNRDQLYVQAATVDYDRSGTFQDKVVLYGTINRGQAASPSPMLPSDMFNGSGGLQNLFNLGQ